MSETMRAMIIDKFGDANTLRPADVSIPEPSDDEVLVAVKASGINPIDIKTRNGDGVNRGWSDDPFPVILGWDISGTVIESRSEIFKVGDEVFSMPRFPALTGGYAQYATIPEMEASLKPQHVDHIHAAAVPLAALTAWQALVDTANIQPGQRVLVQAAAGGVGHFAVQIAKHRGAYVIGTASPRNADFLAGLGVDEVIDYTTTDVGAAISNVDVVFHMLRPEFREASWRTLKPGGHLLSITGPVETDEAARYGGHADFIMVRPSGAQLSDIADLIDAGTINPVVDEVYPLDEVADAHRHVEGGHTRGKAVLSVES